MKKFVLIFGILTTTGLCLNAQILGNASNDSLQKKNVTPKEPKSDLKAFDYNPGNGSSQNPGEKKTEELPELAPAGKPKH